MQACSAVQQEVNGWRRGWDEEVLQLGSPQGEKRTARGCQHVWEQLRGWVGNSTEGPIGAKIVAQGFGCGKLQLLEVSQGTKGGVRGDSKCVQLSELLEQVSRLNEENHQAVQYPEFF